jgi:branched-chain amino acid aminotransferase
MFRRGVIYTPPKATILEGITRDTVMTLAADMNVLVVEEMISRDQLYIAEEVFITGTAAEIVSVCKIDHRQVSEGKPGQIAKALQKAYTKVIHGQGQRAGDCLDYLPVDKSAQDSKVLIDH